MKTIAPEELVGYSEDPTGLSRFERAYRFPSLLGLLVFIGGFILFPLGFRNFLPFAVCALGMLIILATIWVMFKATPISSFSGQPMEKYWNSSPMARGNEVIYVCRQSKTYFRRTFARRGKWAP